MPAVLPDPERRPDAIRTASGLLSLARIDCALLFPVVALMVLETRLGRHCRPGASRRLPGAGVA